MVGYLELHANGELKERARDAVEQLAECCLCPRQCGVARSADEAGFCGVGRNALLASANIHFGEEAPLVGDGGSGTIFFAGCNLNCHFCQNYDISHSIDRSIAASSERLAEVMLDLQRRGAHNINLVTPSHVVAQWLEALVIAADQGLTVPLVYNTSGYDETETLKLLDGVVDIYMPDIKIASPGHAERFCQARDYPEKAKAALREMHRQVGDLIVDPQGIATHGLLVRHLVMPSGIAGTKEWMAFLAEEISTDTYLNIMGQYRPSGFVLRHPEQFQELACALNSQDMSQAYQAAKDAGLTRLDQRRRPAVDFFKLFQGE